MRSGRLVHFPSLEEHARVAAAIGGVASHLSAAVLLGVPVKWRPTEPWVTVPRHRRVRGRPRAHVVMNDVLPEETTGLTTSPLRTLTDCARRLPFDEALAVSDAMVRRGLVDRFDVDQAAKRARGPGSAAVRRVAEMTDGGAENPFESCLRAIALGIDGLEVRAQWPVDVGPFVAHPDVADPVLRIAMEADSWEYHTRRAAHDRDCERFSLLAASGWTVLRFSWEQVMYRPVWVADVIGRTAERARGTDNRQAVRQAAV